ncbi:MAG: efflux RND transporter periplasmic adaptor subunit [Planctomycetota bacterium]
MKGVITLVVLAGVSAAIFALGTLRKGAADKSLLHVADEVPLTVNVVQPERESITRLVQAPGDVEAVLEVEISSEIVSKIEEMPVEEGHRVHKGDLLCRLDDRHLVAEIESAEARISQIKAMIVQADAELEKAERDLARQVMLSESSATSDLELRDYQTVRNRLRAVRDQRQYELAQADAGLKRINEDLARTIIHSPIDGVISKLNAKQGEVVVTGTMNNPGTVIMSISDLSHMQVRAKIDEIDVPSVKPDQPARLYLQADQDRPVLARVLRVASKGSKPLGRDVVTFETLLEVLSDDPRIKPGMTANVEIEVAKEDNAITVPVEAVVHRMRKELPDSVLEAFDRRQSGVGLSDRARQAQYIKVVFLKDGDAAKVRLVEPGIADTRRVSLLTGVEVTDTVIVGPYRSLDQLKENRKVALAKDEKDKEAKPKGSPTEAAAEKEKPQSGSDEAKTGDHEKKSEDAERQAEEDRQRTASASDKP